MYYVQVLHTYSFEDSTSIFEDYGDENASSINLYLQVDGLLTRDQYSSGAFSCQLFF